MVKLSAMASLGDKNLSQDILFVICPVSTVANVENNELQLENNAISGHIHIALFSICLILVSYYSAFFSVCGTDANVLNGFNTLASGECRIMRYEDEANGE